jgi:hypothetical protein
LDGLLGVNPEAAWVDVDRDLLCKKRASHHGIPLGDVCRDSFLEAGSAESRYVLI